MDEVRIILDLEVVKSESKADVSGSLKREGDNFILDLKLSGKGKLPEIILQLKTDEDLIFYPLTTCWKLKMTTCATPKPKKNGGKKDKKDNDD